jgi:hypothetical protein
MARDWPIILLRHGCLFDQSIEAVIRIRDSEQKTRYRTFFLARTTLRTVKGNGDA